MVYKHTSFALFPIGTHTQITTDGAVTLTIPDQATGIIMQNVTASGTASATARYTLDGSTAASSTIGFLLEPGDAEVRIDGIKDIRLYLDTASVIDYQWFKAL